MWHPVKNFATKDKKQARIIISMTEKEAASVLKDIIPDVKSKSTPTWLLMLAMKDHFDGQMIITTQETEGFEIINKCTNCHAGLGLEYTT